MRQVTIVKTFAKYEELNEEQKQKVLEKMYDLNVEHDWHDGTLEDRKEILKLLGFSKVKFSFSGFSCQGDGASFTGQFLVPQTKEELKERMKKVKEYAPNFKLFDFSDMSFSEEEREEGRLEVFRISHHYSHSGTVSSDNADLTAFVRDFSNQLYRDLEEEHDYLTSRLAIEETIEANEYEFDLETLKLA